MKEGAVSVTLSRYAGDAGLELMLQPGIIWRKILIAATSLGDLANFVLTKGGHYR